MSALLPSLFILEGPDCCGKTTLGKFICRKYRSAFMHAQGGSELHAGMMTYHMSIIRDVKICMDIGSLSVVLDRHWMSEWCYGRALQRDYNGYDFDKILEELRSLHPIYVFCHSDKGYDRQLVDNNHAPLPKDEFVRVVGEYGVLWEILNPNSKVDGPMAQYMRQQCEGSGFIEYDLERDGCRMGAYVDCLMNFAMERKVFA